LSDPDRHFERVRDLKAFERRLLKLLIRREDVLDPPQEALARYALALAQLDQFRTPDGRDVSLADEVDPLRRWVLDELVPTIPADGEPDVPQLRRRVGALNDRVHTARSGLLENHPGDFDAEHLDDELRHKELVLVLGGGGGAGLFHLGLFQLLDELEIVPEFIVGSSMGSIMGLVRALSREYDPFATALSLPRDLDREQVFRPFTGYSRYGFPGAFHLNLLRVAREIFDDLMGTPDLRFQDLAIPLEIVVCGIRTGFDIDAAEYEKEAPESTTPLSIRQNLRLFFNAVRQLTRNRQMLEEVVFGRDRLTANFPVVEAMGFSCTVPGLLHYDIFHDDPATIGPLETLFDRHDLLRLCDGGVVNNVPSDTAWESVYEGKIGTRNTFIAAFDVFAPVPRTQNVIWIPVQRLVRPTVLAKRPYSDFHKTYREPPSPLQVIVNSYSAIRDIVDSSREELTEERHLLEKAVEPLPPYGVWRDAG
jgi:predicted acylesterase/phospholipase RssA